MATDIVFYKTLDSEPGPPRSSKTG